MTCREQEPAPHLLPSQVGADDDFDLRFGWRFGRRGLSPPYAQWQVHAKTRLRSIIAGISISSVLRTIALGSERCLMCFQGFMPKRASGRQDSVRDRTIPPLAMITAGKNRPGELWLEAAEMMIDCCADHTDIGRWASRLGREPLFIV